MIRLACLLAFVLACSSTSTPHGSPDAARTGSGDSGHPTTDSCLTDSCVCPFNEGCTHACTPGGDPCHVQCAPSTTCDVTCDSAEECHVEAGGSSQVMVDCAGSPDCNVTCPATGCTVTNCVGAACTVSCGGVTAATRNGTTATCP